MKVSKNWLKELVNLQIPMEELMNLIPLRVQGGMKGVGETYFELDLKGYNRSDLLSLRGVAYEISALTNSPLLFKEESASDISHLAQLQSLWATVEDPTLCPLYCLVRIEGLNVQDSPPEWEEKLESSGMRPVNNVADVTNLVMLEYGQPLHAFDAAKVKDQTIIVRVAKQGEVIKTLDGKQRSLTNEDLLIADPEKAIGIAGVMGGENSEITDSTTSLLLEAAIFDPKSLRKTATRLALQSEASKRFYHGLTKERLLESLVAAVEYYQRLGGKVTGFSLVGNIKDLPKTVGLDLHKTQQLIGVEISAEQIEGYLRKFYFSIENKQEESGDIHWVFNVPYWRTDIEIEEDLIEEVARMYGYENIPPQPLTGQLPAPTNQAIFKLISNLKTSLKGLGLTEVQTYPFYSTQVLENLELNLEDLVRIANPISAETQYLQTDLWPNLLESAVKNVKQNFTDLAIFQIARIYHSQDRVLPEETYRLSLVLANNSENPFLELYQIFKQVNGRLNLGVEAGEQGSSKNQPELFHPNRNLNLKKGEQVIGTVAEVHPRIINRFGVDKRIAIAEISLEA